MNRYVIGTKIRLNGFRLRRRTPTFVIPAKAGIHALTSRERTPTAIPPPTSTRRPHFVFPAKAHPEPRYGGGIQRGVGGANFHSFVCRHQPACAIATKACPGPRSGMPLNGFRVRRRTPTFVIPAKAGIHALTSRERTPTAIPPPTSTRRPHFVFPARALPELRYGAGTQRGVGGANFHSFVCRHQPACAIATKACPGPRSGMPLNGFRVRRRTPTFVIPAKAGIHALIFRERTSTAIPPPTSTRRPHFVFPARAGIQRKRVVPIDTQALPTTSPCFRTLVCWRQPARRIAMKTVESRHPPRNDPHQTRHSSESWNPEGVGRGKTIEREKTWQSGNFILLCDLRKTTTILAIDAVWALRLRQIAESARPCAQTTQRWGQT